MESHPHDELYWFLISNSFRTYRYLPIYFREFYPNYREPTPDWAIRLIDELAGSRYPTAYDPLTGIVHGHFWSGCRPGGAISDVTPERLRNPHVEFFATQNPGYVDGDELCCISRHRCAKRRPHGAADVRAARQLEPLRL